MSIKLILFLNIFLLICGTACSTTNESDVVFVSDEEVSGSDSNEVVISDSLDFQGNSPGSKLNGLAQTQTTRAKDNSEITVMIDDLGNKSEMRVFSNHPRLASILVRTAVDGRKETFAYDHTGKVKSLPSNIFERAMTASADEIANSAGIYSTITETPAFVQNTKKPDTMPLQPMPSSQFPIQNQRVEQTLTEEIESPTDSIGKNTSADNNSQPPEKRQTLASTKKPGEQ